MAQRMSPNILTIRDFQTIFHVQSNRFDASMVFNMAHSRIYGRKIISKHCQLVRISYQNLDFHGISRFSAVFITNNLNAWRYNSFYRSDKKTPELCLQALRLLMMKTAEKRLLP
jgi:hypothetical protein